MKTLYEAERGCGYRKKGGLYLRSDGIGQECGRLPIELTVCPCCNQGIKPARGFTWISGEIIKNSKCPGLDTECAACPMFSVPEKVGLLWVGGKFYPTPESFTIEANKMGVSKRIAQVPKDLVLGETWVAIAHREVKFGEEKKPGIFRIFKPTRIEYVVRGNETMQELKALEKRGIEPVKVIPLTKEEAEQFAQ